MLLRAGQQNSGNKYHKNDINDMNNNDKYNNNCTRTRRSFFLNKIWPALFRLFRRFLLNGNMEVLIIWIYWPQWVDISDCCRTGSSQIVFHWQSWPTTMSSLLDQNGRRKPIVHRLHQGHIQEFFTGRGVNF